MKKLILLFSVCLLSITAFPQVTQITPVVNEYYGNGTVLLQAYKLNVKQDQETQL